jgi:hypothetical protein
VARESAADKAVRLIAEHRIRVVKANERGIALEVTGDSGDYRVLRYTDGGGVREECTCASPSRNCSHIIAARLLWRP